MARNSPTLDLAQCLQHARDRHGKSYVSQIVDIARLAMAGNGITAQDYYDFQLYDDARIPADEKRRFLSDNKHRHVVMQTADMQWWGACDDKLLTYAWLQGLGAPIPHTQALVHPLRRMPGVTRLRTKDELVHWLRTDARYPLFAKPVSGIQSRGASSVDARDGDRLVLFGGQTIGIDTWADEITQTQGQTMGDGQLIQSRMSPHPWVTALSGSAVSTVRVIALVFDDRVEISGVVWKLPALTAIADNYWRDGNLAAWVDPDTGIVERVVHGAGPGLQTVEAHPETGQRLVGIELLFWPRIREMVLEYAAFLPRVRYQGWDIALGPDGPVVMEVNTGSAFRLAQIASGKGVLTERFKAFLAESEDRIETSPKNARRKKR